MSTLGPASDVSVVVPGRTRRASPALAWALALAIVFALLPLVLSTYQLSLATEILIFALLAMSIDMLAGQAGLVSLGHGAIFGTAT
jgi:branched-chain amino acid transport system permease protein